MEGGLSGSTEREGPGVVQVGIRTDLLRTDLLRIRANVGMAWRAWEKKDIDIVRRGHEIRGHDLSMREK